MFKGLLKKIGLVRYYHLALVKAELAKVRADLEKTASSLERSRQDCTKWKSRHDKESQRAAALDKEIRGFQKIARETDYELNRDNDRARALADVQAQLEIATHDLALAREHLMTVEVKLDILEGAANALDSRTRAAVPMPVKPGAGAGVPS